ncbi:MAG TPA: YceI family protein, partial [Trebonia sp.]|nr:YceI family protein [Trebonia sp.]
RTGKLTGRWTLDGSRSEVRLRSKSMWGLAKVNGVFRQVAGTGTVTDGGDVTGTITVSASSIDTKNKKRDDHLRSADFFEASTYPDITFAVDHVAAAGQEVTVHGSLTVRGKTRPLAFPAAVSSLEGDELWLAAEVAVNRRDFEMTWSQLGMASMDNTIAIHAVFARA